MKDQSKLLVLILISGLLAPIIGGQISTDSLPLLSGGLIGALVGGGELGILPHLLIALPAALTLILVLSKRTVLQLPGKILSGAFGIFFGLVTISFVASSFRMTALGTISEWLLYVITLYSVVAVAGRGVGPRGHIYAIFAGCSIAAIRGVIEYGQMKPVDPHWRIFGGWVNPNGLAAILMLGVLLGLGLILDAERIQKLILGLLTSLIALALVLTQSRATLACLAFGIVVFLFAALMWRRGSIKSAQSFAWAMTILSLTLTLVIPAVQVLAPISPKLTAKVEASQGGLSRFSAADIGTDQSSTFRRLLWKGVLPIVASKPTGVGMGAYRFSSAQSGLTTQTQLAHESFLQIAVEASPFAAVVLGLAISIWTFQICRTPISLPVSQNNLRAGVLAAVFGVLAHSLVDSDLYYFGIGLSFFMLIGAGLLLAADGVAPEFAAKSIRGLAISTTAAVLIACGYCGSAELARAQLRGALVEKNIESLRAIRDSITGQFPFDPESYALVARLSETPELQLTNQQKAVDLGPSTKNLRALARTLQSAGRAGEALTTLELALRSDPNNLTTLSQLYQLQRDTGDLASAQITANRLVKVEDSPYFTVRSLPELVPTETYEARVFLAKSARGSREAGALLTRAVEGFLEYVNLTLPRIKQQVAQGGDFGGETLERAGEKVQTGLLAAQELQRVAAALGDRALAAKASEAIVAFSAAGSSIK